MVRYTKKALSTANFACMRGVTDFTNAAQFNLYESGYAHLYVISMPKWIESMAQQDNDVKKMAETFKYILEYEFKGLDGIDDISTDPLEVTDGISTMNVIGKVTKQSAAEVTMSFTEKSGSAITNFIRYYLEGIKDPRTQAKTYHGLIKNGMIYGGFENEVFTLLYVVLDNTMLQLEKAYLLCNAWPNSAKTNIYNTSKGEIDKKDIDVTFQCFVLDGPDVDRRALEVLSYTNEAVGDATAVARVYNKHDGTSLDSAVFNTGTIESATTTDNVKVDRVIHLNSSETYDHDGSVSKIDKDGKVVTDYTKYNQVQGYQYTATREGSDIDNYVPNN